jgi:uncharacterized membrane protein
MLGGKIKMKQLKTLIMFVLVLVSIVGIAGVAHADSPDYDVLYVEANDLPISLADGNILDIERGETLDLTVVIEAAASINGGSVDDVSIKAEIEGYEYGDIEDRTSIFEVEEGLTYYKRLKLVIPEDIDASETYTLRIEVSDDDNKETWEFTLHIDEERHKLNIYDVILRPGSSVEAGRPLFVDVRVENLGAKKEENIKVTAAIPELGVKDSRYIDELVPVEGCEAFDCDDNEETSESSGDLFVRIPEGAKSGTYDLEIVVEYNRGHSVIVEKALINVEGVETVKEVGEAIVSVDTTSREIVQGEEVGYRLMVANLGNEPQILSASVDGVQTWADSRVAPGFLTLQPGQTGEMFVYVKAREEATAGQKAFTVTLTSADGGVKVINLNADVAENETGFETAKNVLIGIFIVLVIILVILAIILAVKRIGGGREEALEPTSEGQSYY